MKFFVVGLDDSGEWIPEREILSVIGTHCVFSGGKRHRGLVEKWLPASAVWVEIAVPLEHVFSQYEFYEEIVVFASGDPLFFGFANTIRKRLPEAEITVYPRFNSLQTLAHRLVLPYQDMEAISLTGRSWQEFDRALIEGRVKIGILTDREKRPPVIAARMLEYGYDNYRMTVGERLGNREERIRQLSLEETCDKDFVFPNCLLLEKLFPRERPFGIPEEDFYLLDGRVNMITKMPVRLLTLHMLDLPNRHRLWDIGFCTGSVSIEARLQFPHLSVTGFEIREEGAELMQLNARKFGTPGIETVIGDFTKVDLSDYPSPDAVFIGGHGGKIEQMLEILSQRMEAKGMVVFNSVSEESLELFRQFAEKNGFRIEKCCRMVVDEHHPITVVRARLDSGGEKRER